MEAPLVGAHLLTATPLSAPLPPIQFRLATTRGTNALLECQGAKVAFFVTQGFGDLLRIGDQTRPDLFALAVERQEPLHAKVIEVAERLDARGQILDSLDLDMVRPAAQAALQEGVRTACVALMHAYQNPVHESALSVALKSLGFHTVVTSSETSSRIHFGRRAETALVDAYLAPIMDDYLEKVQGGLSEGGSLRIMTSAGGLATRAHFRPKDSLLSGPAGGVVGAAWAGRRAHRSKLLAFDMGGTSTDVSRIDGDYHYQRDLCVGPARLQTRALRIETVAAGGGSICRYAQGALKVGPESAGASPGPAVYGAKGPITLTDVHALLGRLSAEQFAIPLDLPAAERAWQAFLDDHRLAPERSRDYLQGFLQIANERMANAIRSISVREGADPSEYTLLAFGGAGGLHACALADLLDIETIIVPQEAGILSARGLSEARIEATRERQVLQPWDRIHAEWPHWAEALTEEALAEIQLPRESCEIILEAELRFVGQEASLTVVLADDPLASFHEQYETIFGHLPERPIEMESLRVRVRERPHAPSTLLLKEANAVQDPITPTIAWNSLPVDAKVRGPILVTDAHCTVMVEDGWTIQRDGQDTLHMHRERLSKQASETRPPEVLLELFTQRFRHVVQSMGDQLERTAISTNVKERLDFSCCLLDAEGRLLANAPHIPVHLGAMGLCVRRVLETMRLNAGDVVLTNHPAFGGSHLPDLTVIMPVYHQERLLGFVANRAHHAEIGGIRPGSMPPHASCLEEEGVVIPPMHLFRSGRSCEEDVRVHLLEALFPTRAIEENLADLRAQVASCRTGAQLLRQLVTEHGEATIRDQFSQLYQSAAQASARAWKTHLTSSVTVREALDDGSVIQVTMTPGANRQHLSFAGTSHSHPANLHATPAIVRSALLYVLRLLQTRDLPLNEGLLEGLEIDLPHCFLHPAFDQHPMPPVVGGNVETSQRLVDALLKAFQIVACSQGTMNNLIFGNEKVSYYETICGGAGAGPTFHGAHAVHTHMTNTAITDPEILEWRYPVRLRQFAIRSGSGGKGAYRGGDGVIRELEFLAPLAVSLLTQHRTAGPYGLHGGQPGSPGKQILIAAHGHSQELPPLASIDVNPGDRLRVETPGGGGWGTPPTLAPRALESSS